MKQKSTLSYIVLTITILATAGMFYLAYRIAAAEYAFGRSLVEASKNRGDTTYNLQIRAIQLNPFQARYRVSYSQTNLALANSLATRGEELTNQDRATIQQLVQQSIREAKAAVSLNRLSAGVWANLANIYQNLLNVADGADRWTISTYQQAIALDPNNPQLRLTYGQFLYSLNQFEAAQRQFEVAATLKPDFANARYNLAVAYEQQDKLQLAKLEYENTLTLVDAGSSDYKTVKSALDSLEKKLADEGLAAETGGPTGKSELKGPEVASPSAQVEPKIELPEEAAPELSPSPEASPSPTSAK